MRTYLIVLTLAVLGSACGQGNVCERQLKFEEEDCFPELEQPTTVDREDCDGDRKAYAQCAVRNDDDYCKYYLWLNRGAARREGYTISDTLAPGNDFIQCLDDEGLREQ